MKSFFYLRFILIIFLSFLFFSCQDVFHDALKLLEEMNRSDIPPEKIFIGGNFSYTSGLSNREGFAVLYNIFAVGLCLAGFVTPVVAAIIMPLSSVTVVSWTAIRLSVRRLPWTS